MGIFKREETNVAVASYDKLLERKSKLEKELINVQRKKDLDLDKINKKYESKIEYILRQQKSCDMQIELAKKYTKENWYDTKWYNNN